MAIHKLQIDDFVTVDYKLIAIHSSLEDYRLAYFLNRELGILLEKSPDDIGVKTKEGESSFPRFVYDDAKNETTWHLVRNQNTMSGGHKNRNSLFEESGFDVTTTVFLLPELKKVDYILKVENMPSFFSQDELLESLLHIRHISTAYAIEHKKLKSKNNLIF